MMQGEQDDLINPYRAPMATLGPASVLSPEGGLTTPPTSGNPWLTIWTQPRGTIRQIVNTNPTFQVILLTCLGGICQGLNRAVTQHSGDQLSVGTILALALIGGPIGGLIGLYIGAALLRWVGGLLGGQATQEEVRAALAWAGIPGIVATLFLLPEYLLLGPSLFSKNPKLGMQPGIGYLLIGFGMMQVILGVWSGVLFVRTLGEVHRFSSWRALGASLLLGVIGGIILVAIGLSLALLLSKSST